MPVSVLLALALALAHVTVPAEAQPLDPFEAEAPETLLDFAVGDAEVSLFVDGSWTTGVAPAAGWVISPAGGRGLVARPGFTFPGLEPVRYFNRISMTLSLWLLERYFFEVDLSDDLAASTILFGYVGRGDESVRSVLVGNTGIGIGAYPYIGFGDDAAGGGASAPGASALFRTPRSEHELMVRFSPAEEAELLYADGGIVDETRVAAIDYERAGHYVLPDGGLDFLTVYLESPTGSLAGSDGRRYREVDLQRETSFSLSDGTLSFQQTPTTRVVVYYEAGGLPIGAAGLGNGAFYRLAADGTPDPDGPEDFDFADLGRYVELFAHDGDSGLTASDFRITVGGNEGFLLDQPGRYAPFAVAGWYRVDDQASTVALVSPTGAPIGSSLRIVRYPDAGLLRIQGTSTDPRAHENRYPLASHLLESTAADIYGPAPRTPPGAPELALRTVRPADQITLSAGYIPGSIRVTRNGTTENAFTVLPGGEIVFDRPLESTDVVRVRYRTRLSAQSADLLFATGNRFDLAPGTEADLALGLRWTPPQQRYSTRPGEYPGRLTLSAAVRTDSAAWRAASGLVRAEVGAAVSLSSPDTGGALRLAGMDEAESMIPIAPTSLFAAPAPEVEPGPPAPGLELLGPQRRGRLYYRDYYRTGLLGDRELLAYDLTPAPSRLPYDQGGRIGPYPALSADDRYAGTVAVLEYEVTDSRNWVAGLVRVNAGRGTNLTDVRSLIVPYRLVDATGEAHLFIQIGAIGEDLDGDGVIDEGTRGLPFRDEAAGITLLAGTIPSAGVWYTEDARGNGVLDPELPDLVLSRHAAALTQRTDWRFAELRVTAAQARRLRDTRAVRFLITTTDGDAAGRLLIGDILTLGTGFSVDYPSAFSGGPQVWVRELAEATYGGEPLASAFPGVATRFSLGADQRLLSVAWQDLGGGTVRLTRPTSVPASDYGSLRLFYRLAEASASSVSMTLRAADGTGTIAEASTEITNESWREIELVLPSDRETLITRVEIELSGPDAGEVLLDELSFWSPRRSVGTAAALDLSLRPDVSVTAGDLIVVSELEIDQRLAARSESFPDDVEASRSGFESSTDLAARVLGASTRLGLDLLANRTGTGLQVRHDLRVPLSQIGLTVADRFRVGYGQLEPGVTHATDLTVTAGAVDLAAGWRRDAHDTTRVDWTASAGLQRGGTRAHADTRLTEHRAEEPTVDPYPISWAASYRDLAPAVLPDRRDGSTRLRVAIGGTAVGLELDAAAGFRVDIEDGRRAVDLKYALGLPIRAGLIEVTLRAVRSARIVDAGQPENAPSQDIGSSAALLRDHPIPFAFVPFVELMDPSYAEQAARLTEGLLEARYEPAAVIQARRRVTSTPWSLIVPATARVSVARPAERSLDAARSGYEIQADALAVAPNLFGRLGSHSFLNVYDTDEFQTGVRTRSTGGNGAPWRSTVGVDQRIRLAWVDGQAVRLENVFSFSIPSAGDTSAAASLSWARAAPPGREPIPLPARLRGLERTHHLESTLEIDYKQSSGPTLLARVGHAHTVRFAATGSIRLHGGLGLGTRLTPEGRDLLLGIRAGVEGRLTL